MTVTPVVPVADSQLVADTQSIIMDTDVAFVSVRVYISGWVDVWDDTLGFQNGWTGNFITHAGGERLVLDPPTPFSAGDLVYVNAWDSGGPIDYTFRVGLEKLTTEADLSAPQVVKVDTYTWSARVHDNEAGPLPPQFDGPGNVYLQVLDPRGSEVLVVPGREVGLVWDEGRNKAVIYFVRNETVFYMEADPADVPTTQSQIRSIEATVRQALGGEGTAHQDDATFPPVKKLVTQNTGFIGGGEGSFSLNSSPYDAAPTPDVLTGVLNGAPVFMEIGRPTTSHEDDLLLGYFIVKFWRDTPSIIGFVSMVPEDVLVEFEDSALTPGAAYAVMPLYNLWVIKDALGNIIKRSPETRRERWGAKTSIRADRLFFTEAIGMAGGAGEGVEPSFSSVTYPPVKKLSTQNVGMSLSGEGTQYWVDSSFSPIGT